MDLYGDQWKGKDKKIGRKEDRQYCFFTYTPVFTIS